MIHVKPDSVTNIGTPGPISSKMHHTFGAKIRWVSKGLFETLTFKYL